MKNNKMKNNNMDFYDWLDKQKYVPKKQSNFIQLWMKKKKIEEKDDNNK